RRGRTAKIGQQAPPVESGTERSSLSWSPAGAGTRMREPEAEMRFMVIVKATKDSEAGVLPSQELLEAMGRYNEELVRAGVLLAGEGLHPSAKGARVRFSGSSRTVLDGPFAETKELIAGFWILQVRSL